MYFLYIVSKRKKSIKLEILGSFTLLGYSIGERNKYRVTHLHFIIIKSAVFAVIFLSAIIWQL